MTLKFLNLDNSFAIHLSRLQQQAEKAEAEIAEIVAGRERWVVVKQWCDTMNRQTTRQTQSVFTRPAALPSLAVPPGASLLPDLNQWIHRIEVLSANSGKRYVIAQHKHKRYWACCCRGWITHRSCKHLRELGLPSNEMPYEVMIAGTATGVFVAETPQIASQAEIPVAAPAGRMVYSLDEV